MNHNVTQVQLYKLALTSNIMKSCVYFFPLYAPGHLISMVELAKSLIHQSKASPFSINILLYQPNDPSKISPICSSYIQSVRAENLPIHFHALPSIELPTHVDGIFGIFDFLTILIRLYLPHIKAALLASPFPVSGLIIDMFFTDVIDVARELKIPTYIYVSSTATYLSLSFHLSSMQQNDQVDLLEVEDDICVPSLTPIPSVSMPDLLLDMKSASYRSLMYHTRRYMEAKGIIVNSNIHIETKGIEALANGIVTQLTPGRMIPEIYPIGPVIYFGQDNVQVHKCLEWLDKQPAKSVVYLCFGSMGAFEATQIKNIAIGLEQSGHHFLWVLRKPSDDFLRGPSDANLEEFLPKGFLERTKGKGMVWPSWAPQIEILSHEAIGGFVTHCGWNSVLESLWFGVPVIPWPLYSEQHLNAFQLVNDIHTAVALEFDRKNNGFVTAMELEQAIKQLMDVSSVKGRKARERAAEMKSACRKAVQREGVSYVQLQKFATELLEA